MSVRVVEIVRPSGVSASAGAAPVAKVVIGGLVRSFGC
jgi:hypothetical protein